MDQELVRQHMSNIFKNPDEHLIGEHFEMCMSQQSKVHFVPKKPQTFAEAVNLVKLIKHVQYAVPQTEKDCIAYVAGNCYTLSTFNMKEVQSIFWNNPCSSLTKINVGDCIDTWRHHMGNNHDSVLDFCTLSESIIGYCNRIAGNQTFDTDLASTAARGIQDVLFVAMVVNSSLYMELGATFWVFCRHLVHWTLPNGGDLQALLECGTLMPQTVVRLMAMEYGIDVERLVGARKNFLPSGIMIYGAVCQPAKCSPISIITVAGGSLDVLGTITVMNTNFRFVFNKGDGVGLNIKPVQSDTEKVRFMNVNMTGAGIVIEGRYEKVVMCNLSVFCSVIGVMARGVTSVDVTSVQTCIGQQAITMENVMLPFFFYDVPNVRVEKQVMRMVGKAIVAVNVQNCSIAHVMCLSCGTFAVIRPKRTKTGDICIDACRIDSQETPILIYGPATLSYTFQPCPIPMGFQLNVFVETNKEPEAWLPDRVMVPSAIRSWNEKFGLAPVASNYAKSKIRNADCQQHGYIPGDPSIFHKSFDSGASVRNELSIDLFQYYCFVTNLALHSSKPCPLDKYVGYVPIYTNTDRKRRVCETYSQHVQVAPTPTRVPVKGGTAWYNKSAQYMPFQFQQPVSVPGTFPAPGSNQTAPAPGFNQTAPAPAFNHAPAPGFNQSSPAPGFNQSSPAPNSNKPAPRDQRPAKLPKRGAPANVVQTTTTTISQVTSQLLDHMPIPVDILATAGDDARAHAASQLGLHPEFVASLFQQGADSSAGEFSRPPSDLSTIPEETCSTPPRDPQFFQSTNSCSTPPRDTLFFQSTSWTPPRRQDESLATLFSGFTPVPSRATSPTPVSMSRMTSPTPMSMSRLTSPMPSFSRACSPSNLVSYMFP